MIPHIARLFIPLIAAVVVGGCGGSSRDVSPSTAQTTTSADGAPRLVTVVSGLDGPIQVVSLPDASDHLWVIEQRGVIRSVRGARVETTPVADLSKATKSGGEQGLLSVALHPNFPATDLAYIHRTDVNGDTLVTEHRVDAGHIATEPTRVLLQVKQPFANHNGGSLAFGPDGLLYLGLGDGGSGGDPNGNGQNLDSRLGKLLRVDLAQQIDWKIAAYGLRNPWRFSFDPQTGDGWIGDVGQGDWEEIDLFPHGSGVLNYGWSVKEGRHDYQGGGNTTIEGPGRLTAPVAEYSHDDGCSVTGGIVVRDPTLPSLVGRYLYADYCTGTFWSISAARPGEPRKEPFTTSAPVSIDAGRDNAVYVTSLDGKVLRLRGSG